MKKGTTHFELTDWEKMCSSRESWGAGVLAEQQEKDGAQERQKQPKSKTTIELLTRGKGGCRTNSELPVTREAKGNEEQLVRESESVRKRF